MRLPAVLVLGWLSSTRSFHAVLVVPDVLVRSRHAVLLLDALEPQPSAQSQRARRDRLFREMEAPLERRLPDGDAASDPFAPIALTAARAGDDRKAIDVSALRVSHLTSATNFFVNMVGRSKAQINAIVKHIEDEVELEHGRRPHRQGKALGGWVCLDFDSVVVNVFSEAQRDFYGLDKFWSAGQPLDLSDVLTPDAPEEPSAAAFEDDVDDWELDDEDVWGLGDDDWSLPEAASEAAFSEPIMEEAMIEEVGMNGAAAEEANEDESPLSAAQAAVPVPFDFSAAAMPAEAGSALNDALVDEDDPFAAFAAEFRPVIEEEEAVVLTEAEEREAEEREAEEMGCADAMRLGGEGEEEDPSSADWALGDERLRALVSKAERSSEALAFGTEAGSTEEGNNGNDWRSMMAEDGWEMDADESALESQGPDEEEDSDDELSLFR